MFLTICLMSYLGTTSGECVGGDIIDTGLDCTQKQLIVDVHNLYRNQVAAGLVPTQPSAADMVEMRWNEEVACKAQEWADKCSFQHDPALVSGDVSMGQNLHIVKSSSDYFRVPNITEMISHWFNEVYSHGFGQHFAPNSGSGHYSQMIWGNTLHVGCGLSYYFKDGMYNNYLVCNYSPPGNWVGKKPYVCGAKDCLAHNLYPSKRYSHLCAMDTELIQAC